MKDCGLVWLWPLTSDGERTHCVTEGSAFTGCLCSSMGDGAVPISKYSNQFFSQASFLDAPFS